jgi:chitinase
MRVFAIVCLIVCSVLAHIVSSLSSSLVVFSPYKDITINLNWNTYELTTAVTGNRTSVLSVLPSTGANTLTWAFASGTCGSESWGGVKADDLVAANVQSFVSAGYKYIISTGGAAGSFQCTSDADFETFIQRYSSSSLIGFDFDIEGGMGQSDIDSLVQRIANAQKNHPTLRFSFTLATFGGSANPSLGCLGIMTMNSIKSVGLTSYYINLMTMDYGSANSYNCVLGSDSLCDMGKSAIQAAQSLHDQFGVPYSQIELTPMIGGNDAQDETFKLDDVDELTAWSVQNGISGLHHWSFDRDADCSPGWASPTCNSYGQAGTLGFTKRFTGQL